MIFSEIYNFPLRKMIQLSDHRTIPDIDFLSMLRRSLDSYQTNNKNSVDWQCHWEKMNIHLRKKHKMFDSPWLIELIWSKFIILNLAKKFKFKIFFLSFFHNLYQYRAKATIWSGHFSIKYMFSASYINNRKLITPTKLKLNLLKTTWPKYMA